MKTKMLCIVGFGFGAALLLWGGSLPGWITKIELLLFSLAALAWGFASYSPRLPRFLMEDAVRGTIFVHLGIFAMFIPPQFIVSAFLIGAGTRLVMKGFEPKPLPPAPEKGYVDADEIRRTLAGGRREIVVRHNRDIVKE